MAGFNWTSLKFQVDNTIADAVVESDAIANIKKKFKHTSFVNIPDYWVNVIDEMLCNMRDPGSVKEVKQEYGQLVIEFRKGFDFPDNRKFVQEAESKIYNLGKDTSHESGTIAEAEPTGDKDKKMFN